MLKSIVLVIGLFNPPADTTFGIVTFGAGYHATDTISVLNADGTVWHQFSFLDGFNLVDKNRFLPQICDPDYLDLVISVVSSKGTRYEIIADEETGLRKFVIADNKKLKFESYQNYILHRVIGFDSKTNPPRKTINGEILNDCKSDRSSIISFKGDWIKIELYDEVAKTETSGWLRWRKGSKLLIWLYKD
jgi:hypothetical protein